MAETTIETAAPARNGSAVATRPQPMVVGGAVHAIYPKTSDEVTRLARAAVLAGTFKAAVARRRRQEGELDEAAVAEERETAIHQATVVILKGLEIGLPPMAALENIAVINGRTCVWGAGIPMLLWRNGFEIDEEFEGSEEDGTLTAVCTITRPNGKTIKRKFSIRDAVRAKLWDTREKVKRKGSSGWFEVENDSPWFRFAPRMLQMRARGFCARDGASDVLGGLYVVEEMQDEERAALAARELLNSAPQEQQQQQPTGPRRGETVAFDPFAEEAQVVQQAAPAAAAAPVEAEATQDPPLADPQSVVDKIISDLAEVSIDERPEVLQGHADMIERLPREFRSKIYDWIEEH